MTLTRAIAAVALLAVLAVLGMGLAGGASPGLDVAAHLMGHALVMLPFAAWAVFRDRWGPAVLAVGVVVGVALPVALSQGRVDGAVGAPDPGAIRVLSINTWHRHPDHPRLVAAIEAHDADVVLLYEFGPDKLPLLDALRSRYPHQVGCPEQWRCAVVMLSRERLVGSGFSPGDRGTSSPLVWGRLADGLTIAGTHLERPLDSPAGHLSEIRWLARQVRRLGGPIIIAGDFNTTRWAASWRAFRDDSGLRHMGRFLPSWPAGSLFWPQIAIDHAWASPGLRFERVALGADVGSDHLPLLVEVTRPPGSAGR